MASKGIRPPNTFLLIFLITVFTACLSWVLPGGRYGRVEVEGRSVVDADSYEAIPAVPQGVGAVLTAPLRGFVAAAEIIAFVLIVGGAFKVLGETGAIDAGVRALARAHGRYRVVELLWIPLFMTVFSLGGAVFGMSEEVIPFVLVFVPLSLSLGYDSVVGVAIPFVGAGAGFAGAFLNPFTVGIAQGIAEVPLFSGIGYRLVCWLLVTGVAIAYVQWYAVRVQRRPEVSPVASTDAEKRHALHLDDGGDVELTRSRAAVLVVFGLGLVLLVVGVLRYGWYIEEIAALFFGTAVVAGLVGGLSGNRIADAMVHGARDLMATGLIIAVARGILVVAEQGQIIDSILHSLAGVVSDLPPALAAQSMFAIQSVLNFFVPSGSGQAALTMPIMAPLADLLGVTRQTAVLAFQFGDGFSNLIIPTSAVCMGVLALADIPWEKWARWMLPLQAILFLLGLALLVPPALSGWM